MPKLTRSKPLFTAALLAVVLFTVGCQSRSGNGALIGAAAGAIAGQAIGGDTEGTLIGTAVGAGAGYIVGNELDKKEEREAREAEAYQRPRNSPRNDIRRRRGGHGY